MGDRDRIAELREMADRCLQARDGRRLDEQLSLTRLALKCLLDAAGTGAASSSVPAWRQNRARDSRRSRV